MAELVRLPDVAMAVVRRRKPAGLPPIGKSVVIYGDRFIAIGPDEWLVLAPDADADVLLTRLGEMGISSDVSGSRVRYRLRGAGALDLLAAGCGLDSELLVPGAAAATVLARIQVVILVEDAAILLLPRRSFGHYLENWAQSVIPGLNREASTYRAINSDRATMNEMSATMRETPPDETKAA